MILRERERSAVVCVWLLVAGVFLACVDRFHTHLECAVGFSQIVDQPSKLSVVTSPKPTSIVFSPPRDAGEMVGQ